MKTILVAVIVMLVSACATGYSDPPTGEQVDDWSGAMRLLCKSPWRK